jgi:hypothetical protein
MINIALFSNNDNIDSSIIRNYDCETFADFKSFIKSEIVTKVFYVPEVDLIKFNELKNKENIHGNKENLSLINYMDLHSYANDIKTNNVQIIIDIGTGGLSSEYFKDLFELIRYFSFNPKHVTFLVNTKVEYNILQDMIVEQQLPILVVATNRNELILVEDFLSYKRSKRFLFLCRRWAPERLFMFLDLHKRKILDNCLYSFTFDPNPYGNNKPDASLDELFLNFIGYYKNAKNKEYVESIVDYWNTNKKEITEVAPNWFGKNIQVQHDAEVSSKFYDTYMSLCVETNFLYQSPYFQPSEKIYKSCFFRHPFLTYSNHNFLKSWNRSGYKSFENIFDESYDNESDNFRRIQMINDEVEKINDLTHYEFMLKIQKSQQIINHNQNLLTEKFSNPKQKNLMLNSNPIIEEILTKQFKVTPPL